MIQQTNQQRKEHPHPCPHELKALTAACRGHWKHLSIRKLLGRFGRIFLQEKAHKASWCAGSLSIFVVSSAGLCAIMITAVLLSIKFALHVKTGAWWVGDAEGLSGGNLKWHFKRGEAVQCGKSRAAVAPNQVKGEKYPVYEPSHWNDKVILCVLLQCVVSLRAFAL